MENIREKRDGLDMARSRKDNSYPTLGDTESIGEKIVIKLNTAVEGV